MKPHERVISLDTDGDSPAGLQLDSVHILTYSAMDVPRLLI